MNLLKEIIWSKNAIFVFFLGLHLLLLNVNVAEWGDSYRILRASRYFREGSYPMDEKRPPLYSALLATYPNFVDPVLWGRILMLVLSVASFFLFERILNLYQVSQEHKNLGLLLFSLNPVYLYWSLRLMADATFSLFVLLTLYLLARWKDRLNLTKVLTLGILCGLSVLTRFEGYLLFGAVFMGIYFSKGFCFREIFLFFSRNFVNLGAFVATFSVTVLPWLLYKNPFTSSYFEEPTGRSYDLNMVLIYLVSLIFVFGFVQGFFMIFKDAKNTFAFLLKNPGPASFILFELILILLWPAAIPRLFVGIIPLLILVLILSISRFFETPKKVGLWVFLPIPLYIAAQYFLRLQFLVLDKQILLVVVLLQTAVAFTLLYKKFYPFVFFVAMSTLVWSLYTVFLHKDIFIAVKNAGEYASQNIKGRVAYNDVSSVSDWYLNQQKILGLSGFYYNFEKDALLTFDSLSKKGLDYLLITNEHNTTLEIDLSKRPYLKEIQKFSYNINGKLFFASIVKFDKDYIK